MLDIEMKWTELERGVCVYIYIYMGCKYSIDKKGKMLFLSLRVQEQSLL